MSDKHQLLSLSPQDFIKFLTENKIKKFYFVFNHTAGTFLASHYILQPIADYFSEDKRDFIEHEGMFFQVSGKYEMLHGAFVHSTNRGQAAGGVRFWKYDNIENYVRDGVRLAAGMTFKNALAGLWWGGGKGVIMHNPTYEWNDPEVRKHIYKEYGLFISSLKGCYVTAEDLGTKVKDMIDVFSGTRFTTCIPPELGGSGVPAIPTARGVVCGMEAAVDFLKLGSLQGKTIAVQGLGHVGIPLAGFLFEKGVSKIIGCDVNPDNVKEAKEKYEGQNIECRLVDIDDTSIFSEECVIFSPNATGAILNSKTIPMLKAKIVCGAANNQLEDMESDGKVLYEKGITFVPDFLTNRMGIVNCANEQYGYVNNDSMIEQHFSKDWEYSIYNSAIKVLEESKSINKKTAEIALKIADELSKVNHPIFGHRGKEIIKSLVKNEWHLN
ncbi:MAG: leucine dehydrogenase [Ignavibacteriae bacterium]|nr:MAG: leucine dehydrogenase [Ignavibacteriota bacterium]